jgi:hypothetical protein
VEPGTNAGGSGLLEKCGMAAEATVLEVFHRGDERKEVTEFVVPEDHVRGDEEDFAEEDDVEIMEVEANQEVDTQTSVNISEVREELGLYVYENMINKGKRKEKARMERFEKNPKLKAEICA